MQILVFQRGVLGRTTPSERIRLLVEWPVTPVAHLAGGREDRRADEPLVGRAVIRLQEAPEASDADGRSVAEAASSVGAR